MESADLPLSRDWDTSAGRSRPVVLTKPRIPGYDVLDLLGQGGMGTVWHAIENGTRRPVALKVLSLPMASTRARARFEREIELSSRLNHPNIVRVHHSGLGEGFLFYAMELVQGVHLDQYVRMHQLGASAVLSLMRQICLAVHHAHQRGVLHRDLKPSNILVSEDGQPHVLDFGLAKALEAAGPTNTVTREGAVAGTLAYMAPEQAAGLFDQLDTRADVYSLGVILFHLLLGQWPHDSTLSQFHQQKAIVEGNLRRPRQIDPHFNHELETILLKTLEKDPARRYGSAGDMAEDLRRYLHHEVLLARPLTTSYFLRKFVGKHRVGVMIALSFAVALMGLATFGYLRIRIEKQLALEQTVMARRSDYFKSISLASSEMRQGNLAAAQLALQQAPQEHRHWEWHRLRYLSDQSVATLSPLPRNTVAMAYRAVDDRLVTASVESGVSVWDVSQSRKIGELPWRGALPSQVFLSEDGRFAGCLEGNQVTVRETLAGNELGRVDLPGLGRSPRSTLVNGSLLAILMDQEVVLVDMSSARQWHRQSLADSMRLVSLGPEGQLLLQSLTGLILMQEGEVRNLPQTLPKEVSSAPLLVRMEGELVLLLTLPGGTIQCREILDGTLRWQIDHAFEQPGRLWIHPKATVLAHVDHRGKINLWQLPDLRGIGTYQGHGPTASTGLCWLGDEARFATLARGNSIKLWQREYSLNRRRSWLLPADHTISHVSGSDNGTIAAIDLQGNVFLWSQADHAPRTLADRTDFAASALLLSPDGANLWVADRQDVLHQWNLATGQKLQTLAGPGQQITQLVTDPQQRWLVVASRLPKPQLHVMDRQGRVLANFPGNGPVYFQEDGDMLLLVTQDRQRLEKIDTRHWKSTPAFASLRFEVPITRAAVSSQSGWMVLGDATGQIQVVDSQQNRIVHRFQTTVIDGLGHLALSPDGKRLLVCENRTLGLWDVATGTLLMDVGENQAVTPISAWFTHGGQRIVVQTSRGLIEWDR